MDPVRLLGIVIGFAVLFLTSRVIGRHPGFLGETFYRDRGLRWPPGIQEQDDVTWRWTARQPRIDPPEPRLARRVPDPDESLPGVDVEPVHPSVHAR